MIRIKFSDDKHQQREKSIFDFRNIQFLISVDFRKGGKLYKI